MISENLIRRTYAVKCGESIGSATVIDLNKKRYLISANHVFSSYATIRTISCLTKRGWIEIEHSYVVHGGSNDWIDDFIVFEIGGQLQDAPDLQIAGKGETWIAQEVLALGYPLLTPSPLWNSNAGFATAFAKRGIISSVVSSGGFDSLFMLDLLLNRGMSGGPVVSIDYSNSGRFRLIAIGVGFYSPNETLKAGEAEITYNPNTGLAFGIPIDRILLAIDSI
jgi:S1-C subfamily serine protease